MGRIAKLLSFLRVTRNGAQISDAKVNPGGGPNITAQHFSAPGDDSHPIPGDYVSMSADSGSGRESAVGYVDSLNTPKAQPGDKRIYARDGDGAVIVEVWLKNTGEATILNTNGTVTLRPDGGSIITTPLSTLDAKADGSIKADNGAGSYELTIGGTFSVNGVTIDASGNVSIPTSLVLAGKEIAGHGHSQSNDSGGNTESDTGPNN